MLYRIIEWLLRLPMILGDPNHPKPPEFLYFVLSFASS